MGAWGAGWVYQQRGEYTAARAVFEKARRAAEPFAGFMPFLEVMAEAGLGSVMLEMGADTETALALHAHALQVSDSPVGGMANGTAWADMGWSALRLGQVELAQSLFERALDYPSFLRLVMKPRSLIGLAELASLRGDFATAEARINEARANADETGMRPYQPLIALATGNLHAARGAHENALRSFADAETLAKELNLRPMIASARLAAARELELLGRAGEAAEKRAQAQAMLQEIADLIPDADARLAFLNSVSLRPEMQNVI
jgi:ATP/maltotriose-dependent transcriptional regulator MalT